MQKKVTGVFKLYYHSHTTQLLLLKLKVRTDFFTIKLPDGTCLCSTINEQSHSETGRYTEERVSDLLSKSKVIFEFGSWPMSDMEIEMAKMVGLNEFLPWIRKAMVKKDAKVHK